MVEKVMCLINTLLMLACYIYIGAWRQQGKRRANWSSKNAILNIVTQACPGAPRVCAFLPLPPLSANRAWIPYRIMIYYNTSIVWHMPDWMPIPRVIVYTIIPLALTHMPGRACTQWYSYFTHARVSMYTMIPLLHTCPGEGEHIHHNTPSTYTPGPKYYNYYYGLHTCPGDRVHHDTHPQLCNEYAVVGVAVAPPFPGSILMMFYIFQKPLIKVWLRR